MGRKGFKPPIKGGTYNMSNAAIPVNGIATFFVLPADRLTDEWQCFVAKYP